MKMRVFENEGIEGFRKYQLEKKNSYSNQALLLFSSKFITVKTRLLKKKIVEVVVMSH
jgi:hypothetical protein